MNKLILIYANWTKVAGRFFDLLALFYTALNGTQTAHGCDLGLQLTPKKFVKDQPENFPFHLRLERESIDSAITLDLFAALIEIVENVGFYGSIRVFDHGITKQSKLCESGLQVFLSVITVCTWFAITHGYNLDKELLEWTRSAVQAGDLSAKSVLNPTLINWEIPLLLQKLRQKLIELIQSHTRPKTLFAAVPIEDKSMPTYRSKWCALRSLWCAFVAIGGAL